MRVKQAIIENSRCVMLGVDHTKFGRNAMVNLGDISQINMLFTDQLPPASLVECLQGNEIHFEVVE